MTFKKLCSFFCLYEDNSGPLGIPTPDWFCSKTSDEVCGGTGWTQNSWHIGVFINYSDVINTGTGDCNAIEASYLYNLNFVKNKNLSGLECDESCYSRSCD